MCEDCYCFFLLLRVYLFNSDKLGHAIIIINIGTYVRSLGRNTAQTLINCVFFLNQSNYKDRMQKYPLFWFPKTKISITCWCLPMLVCEIVFVNTASTFSIETADCCGGEDASLISITYVLLHSGHFVSPETRRKSPKF